MSLKAYNIDVPITPGVMPPVIHIGQYDSGRDYICHLKNDDGTDYTIPSGTTATFTGCNPRKEVFELEATVDTSANTITITPKDEATSMFGKYGATLNLTLNDEQMSPIVILMDVQKAGATDEEIAGAANFPDAVTEAVNDFLEEALEEGDLGSLYVTKAAQIPATEGMTQPVGITPEGALVTAPGGGGEAAVTPASIVTATGQMTTTQKASTRSNIGAGTYSKPSGGVPKTDLASAVQTSLGKADTALQSVGAEDVLDAAEAFTSGQQNSFRGFIGAASTDALTAYVPKSAQGAKTVNDTQEVHIDSSGKLWTQPGGGGGDTPVVIENTQLITVDYYAGDNYASMTAAQIYAALQDGAVNFVLIDRAGRECALDYAPEDETDVAKFYTYDEGSAEIIVYTVSANGIVTDATRHVGTYDKPGTGIPQTDLATALSNKINGALQTGNLDAKTSAMTQAVGYDSTTGKLYTAPGGGGGSYTPETVALTMTVGATSTELSVALSFTDLSAKIAAGARLVSQVTVGYDTVGIEWHANGANTTQQGISLYTIFEDASGENLLIAYLSETGTDEMSGVVESHPVGNAKNPTITPKTGASPSAFSLADNAIYECETLTALTITSAPASGSSIITFTSGTTATTASFPASVEFSDDQPDVINGVFVPSANYYYEINIRNRKALISRWAVSA